MECLHVTNKLNAKKKTVQKKKKPCTHLSLKKKKKEEEEGGKRIHEYCIDCAFSHQGPPKPRRQTNVVSAVGWGAEK